MQQSFNIRYSARTGVCETNSCEDGSVGSFSEDQIGGRRAISAAGLHGKVRAKGAFPSQKAEQTHTPAWARELHRARGGVDGGTIEEHLRLSSRGLRESEWD